jgi:GntR family transcriptional regulator / MocR family aminotransferase
MQARYAGTGAIGRSSSGVVNRTSRPAELLLSIDRHARAAIGRQIEDQLRARIRSGALRGGTALPSTRDLARQLEVSRGVVVSAYAQLGTEGYLVLRQGARPRVSLAIVPGVQTLEHVAPVQRPRFDFRPSLPDVSRFPREAWSRCLRGALSRISDSDLGYADLRGVQSLKVALADYLGRVRGVVADPTQVIVTCGYTQSVGLFCRALAAAGARRIALENPSDPEQRQIAEQAGLAVSPISVDDAGLRVEELERTAAQAVILSPAHQFPSGAAMSGERRTALLTWLRASDAIALEDDYDAEIRYDRTPVGALQGLAPERVIYAGSASKTLAPALRLGWLVVPPDLVETVTHQKRLADRGTARIDQYAFTDFLERGELDRHLRRMRTEYRARRDLLVETLAQAVPDAEVQGIAAGLHATVRIPDGDEQAILDAASRRGIALEAIGEYWLVSDPHPPTLLIGYGQSPEARIPAGVAELAAAILEARTDL